MMRPLETRLLKDEDLKRIHMYTLEILEKNGITFQGRALALFQEKGFRTQGNQVYFTPAQVDTALKTCPANFLLEGRDPRYNLEIGTGKTVGVPGALGPTRVIDLDSAQSREGTLQDVENIAKIYQASPTINMNSNNAVEANDLPYATRHLQVQLATLKHSPKPFYSKILPFDAMNQVLDMTEIAMGGLGSMQGHIYMGIASAPSLSPLAWDETTTDCLMACAMRGQLVTVGTGISTGITGPCRVFGTLVMQNAELLSGIVLTQLVNPGNAVGYGTGAMPGNMRGAKYGCGSPSRAFLAVGAQEMGKRFYNLPCRAETYGTESTGLDVQAGIESYEVTMAAILSGADYMLSEIGTLEGLMTVSYEKILLDEEITERLLAMRRGIDVSDDAASMEVILEVGSGGEYLTSDDTMDYFGEEWYPALTDWNTPEAERAATDYEYVLKRANAAWKARLANAPETFLSPEVDAKLQAYMADCLN